MSGILNRIGSIFGADSRVRGLARGAASAVAKVARGAASAAASVAASVARGAVSAAASAAASVAASVARGAESVAASVARGTESRFGAIPEGMREVREARRGDLVEYRTPDGRTVFRRVHDRFGNIIFGGESATTKSDQEFAELHDSAVAIRYLREIPNSDRITRTQNTGAWFPYFLKEGIPLDLKRYGVYKRTEFDLTDTDNCFTKIFSDRPEYNDLKSIVYGKYTRQKDIRTTVDFLNIVIKLHKYSGGQKLTTTYSPKTKRAIVHPLPVYEIGLLENHFFIVEDTQYQYSYISHKVWEGPTVEVNGATKPYVVRSNSPKINSFTLLKLLLDRKTEFLDEFGADVLSTVHATEKYDPFVKPVHDFHPSPDDCDLSKPVVAKGQPYLFKEIVYADIETFSYHGRHVPYLFALKLSKSGETKSWWGEDCVVRALHYLSELENPLIYFHNLGYDSRFILDNLYNPDSINTSGSRCIMMKGWFNKKMLVFHDTLALVSAPLSKFAKMFNLQESKFEDFPYDLYTRETVGKMYLPESPKYSMIPEKYHKTWLINNKRHKIVDHVKYATDYCLRDVEVLCSGFEIFKGWISTELGIDIDYSLTAASLAHKYMVKEGCYDGVARIGGLTRIFIQNSVVGGRTTLAMNDEYKYQINKLDNDILYDLDAVSLYPSAMMRFDGCPLGKPTVITNIEDRKWMNSNGAYFVQITVTSVGKKLKMPLMSYKTETGRRVWENEIEGKTFVVDRYTLEDWIKYHEIEFIPFIGVQFLDGYNTTIVETMKKLFALRLKLKSEKNPAEAVYKLIMNSAYGKTIEKPHFTETKFVPKEKFNSFLVKNFGVIEECIELEKNYRVEVSKSIISHFTYPQVGSSILSMSKRIMAEVTSVADKHIYYTDTDSIFITQAGLDLLPESLVGINPGQFHVDFAMKGANVRAVEGIFLAPKTYCLRLMNDEGETEYHIRMKGIPTNAHAERVEDYAGDYLKMFKDMENKTLNFDLLAGGKVRFDFKNDLSVYSIKQFERKVGPFIGAVDDSEESYKEF